MRKIVLISSVLVMGLMSCQSPSSLIQVSYYTVMTHDSTQLYIRDCEFGRTLYGSWENDIHRPIKTKVTLVDTTEFKNLCGKATPLKSYLPEVTSNP
jgi:hypothetical protein